MNIDFNNPLLLANQEKSLFKIFRENKFSGDGIYTKKCEKILSKKLSNRKSLLTNSCTSALEMAALLLDIKNGDEIIMPSYTFVSTANAFVLRGAKIVFVDIEPHTMNLDSGAVESAITKKTKAIVCVHYAGLACDIDKLLKISKKHNIHLIEDAAQAIGSSYKGKPLGTFGTFGCISFHDTKNIHCGEGGALIINDDNFLDRAEVIREKGTNRSAFFRGAVDKYRWIDRGSSYLMSEINACFLLDQIKSLDKVITKRMKLWEKYYEDFKDSAIETSEIYPSKVHNAHMFFIKTKSLKERTKLMKFLQKKKISTAFHYIPLHESLKTRKYYRFHKDDRYTTIESERLLRLPLYYSLRQKDVQYITRSIKEFYG